MDRYSTREAARMLGLDWRTIQRYIAAGKIPAPPLERVGGGKFRIWLDQDIEKVRQLLPKIANGRKTRYKKLRDKQQTQPGAPQPQHAKTARAGAPGAVPHKPRKTKKK